MQLNFTGISLVWQLHVAAHISQQRRPLVNNVNYPIITRVTIDILTKAKSDYHQAAVSIHYIENMDLYLNLG